MDSILNRITDWSLAIDGGTKVRIDPMPLRRAFGDCELEMLMEAADYFRNSGNDPGYQGIYENRYCNAFISSLGGTGFADAVATGTASVYLAIAALSLPKGSEVIVSPITDPGTISAIIMNGLVPRLADSKVKSYNMGTEQVLERLNSNVSAVVVVHASGQATDVDLMVSEPRLKGIKIVEDCSQSHGAQINGRQVGTFGDIAAFSTMYRKNHMTGGSGGVVYTKKEAFFKQALAHADRGKPKWIKNFDDRNPNKFLFPALNWNTDELSCAIGIASLKRLPETILRRNAFVSELIAILHDFDTIFSIPSWSPSSSPFIVPVYIDLSRTTHTKMDIAIAIRAEGIDLNPNYQYVVSEWNWVKPYLPDDFITPNAILSRNTSFCLYLNENYGDKEASDIVAAMVKVDRALGVKKKDLKKYIPIKEI